jgi:glucose-6-phosphate 1-dehydrogenase
LKGQAAKGYREELLVDPDSATETFVAVRFHISNWRWAGVPFLMRHGKRLPKKASEIAITFKSPPHQIFGEGVPANTLVIRVQPDEGIALSFEAKRPGLSMALQNVKMDFRYGSSFGQPTPEAYERLLLDGLVGDRSLFTRDDEVELAWGLIQPILDVWHSERPEGFPNYAAGAWGPDEADRLVEGLSSGWRRL